MSKRPKSSKSGKSNKARKPVSTRSLLPGINIPGINIPIGPGGIGPIGPGGISPIGPGTLPPIGPGGPGTIPPPPPFIPGGGPGGVPPFIPGGSAGPILQFVPGCVNKWTYITTNNGQSFFMYIQRSQPFGQTAGWVFPTMTFQTINSSSIVSAQCN
ncbi:hypothetical protein FHS18_005897 [Paenibacillus phyllosphaerae]|uniref:Uncharacterized protein n=1 Tax=Paenibacillus phyllosphaerae TaxID=274593 RepID=A0A7W5B419_9BACL|nr:hypothetical protein [Paenibacillus phyllosphaerae]MBB3113784.1 hypothetical protein [Paenibacillus phyllosphaerae]